MAMLAEPRRKQKISLNPQGKLFMDDKNNKGRALLEKMGWKSGEGLGKDSQGISAPIKLKIQTCTKGLGSDTKEDPWVGHNKSFTQILNDLNAGNQKDDDEYVGFAPFSNSNSSKPPEALESKSKASRSRIHYTKFVKNKDLSSVSDKDLAAIFGSAVAATTGSDSSGSASLLFSPKHDERQPEDRKQRKSRKRKRHHE